MRKKELTVMQQHYRNIFDNVMISLCCTTPGPKGIFVDVNPAMVRMFEADSREQLLACHPREIYFDKRQRDIVSNIIMSQGFIEEDIKFKTLKGRPIWCHISSTKKIDDTGQVYFNSTIDDITERKKAEEKLKKSEEYFRALIENSTDMIFVVDRKATIIYASPSVERICGYKPQELTGKSAFDLIAPVDLPRAIYDFGKAILRKSVLIPNAFHVRHKNGSQLILEGLGSNLLNNPAVAGFIMNVQDVTERKKAEEEVKKLNAELEKDKQLLEVRIEKRTASLLKASETLKAEIIERKKAEEKIQVAMQAKSAFTSMVSHELRTPLAALKESVSQVTEEIPGALNINQKKLLEIAKNNVDRLARLINEVLDFQTLESGKVVFKMQPNDINEVVKDVRETMVSLTKKKNLDLILNLDERLPKVKFDRDKINQVLSNLVNNSLKLTKKGSITISTDRLKNFIQVSVMDTGPGIKKDDMPRLFQQYEQLERKIGGTGLGLAISLGIIKAHNGKIWAESTYGRGATLHFILPIKEWRKKNGKKNLTY